MTFKDEIEVIVDRYLESFEQYTDKTRNLLEEGVAKQEDIKKDSLLTQMAEQIELLDEDFNTQAINQNNLLQVVVERHKEKLFPSVANQAPDYAAKVANAIKFLEIEGESITDEVAYTILKDFIDDYDQMKLFKRMIGKITNLEGSLGHTKFPKTLGKFNQKEYLYNTFEALESFANNLFLQPLEKSGGRPTVIYNNKFQLPFRTYNHQLGEKKVVDLAEEIDNIANQLKAG